MFWLLINICFMSLNCHHVSWNSWRRPATYICSVSTDTTGNDPDTHQTDQFPTRDAAGSRTFHLHRVGSQTHTWTSAFPFSSRSQSVTSNSFRISGSTELLRRLLSSSGLKPARLVWPPPQWRWEKRRLLRWSQISFLYSDPADWSLVSTRSSDSWNHLWTFRPEVKTFIHHWRQRDWNQQPADQPVRTTEAQSVQEQQRMNCVAIWPQISFYSPAAKNLNNVINKKKMDWIHSI